MNRVQTRSTLISVRELRAEASQIFDSQCLECDSSMEIHQPNSEDPSLFLGVCADCGRWYRIEFVESDERICYLSVPGRADLQPGKPG